MEQSSLGKSLLPKGFTKTKSYDPEIIKEGDRYYIMWGAGTYYIADWMMIWFH